MNQTKKQIAVVGIGMDGAATLTREAEQAIQNAELLIGAERMLRPFRSLGKREYISYAPAEYIQTCREQRIAVLVSGDVGFYSAAEKLLPRLENCDVRVCCGIATPVYFASKLGLSWADMRFVSLHGNQASIARQVASSSLTFFLMGGSVTPAALCRRLCDYGLGNVTVHIGENFGSNDERIVSGSAKDFIQTECGRLCAVIAENPEAEHGIPLGIPDEQWIRGGIPMTKAEVRALCVTKLRIGAGDIGWDIGCGTGSVSVEMALRHPTVTVFAVDKNAGAVELTDSNCRQFHCDNVDIIHQAAESAVTELPAPDCVFVGGSGGALDVILETAAQKNESVRAVVTAVSLETLRQCAAVFDRLGWECGISQIAVTRTRKVGSHTMLAAENPIFILERKNQVE